MRCVMHAQVGRRVGIPLAKRILDMGAEQHADPPCSYGGRCVCVVIDAPGEELRQRIHLVLAPRCRNGAVEFVLGGGLGGRF